MKINEKGLKIQKKYRESKKGVVTSMYSRQTSNSKKRGHKLPTYTKEELKEWLYSQPLFHVLYDNWKRLDFQTQYKPSVDRIDCKIGYTMANIQLMTWKQNHDKSNIEKTGEKNHNSKPKEHYVNKGTGRRDFKRVCKRQRWNFEDFEEVWNGEKTKHGNKLYRYIQRREK